MPVDVVRTSKLPAHCEGLLRERDTWSKPNATAVVSANEQADEAPTSVRSVETRVILKIVLLCEVQAGVMTERACLRAPLLPVVKRFP